MAMKPPSPERIAAAVEAVKAHGGNRSRAAKSLGIPTTTLKDWLARAASPPPKQAETAKDRVERLGKIADLLERSGIPVEEIGSVERVRLNEWEGFSKDAEGNPQVTQLSGASVILAPKWAEGPSWPVITQGPPVTIKPLARKPKTPSGWQTAVVLPDIQIGFFRREDDTLEPTHDERALAVALDIVAEADPDVIVMVGDNLDFPELSRYRKMPAFQRTTQASIDRATRLCASLRARVRPECKIVWIAGNHEERLPNYIIDNASASFGLKRGSAPKSWPVLSVPFLCRFDEFGVEFLPGYPASSFRINDHLRVIHGTKVRTGGSTAQSYLPEIRHSTIFGHIHRIEHAAVTRDTNSGPRTYHAVSPGCMCRIDGTVPGVESGYDLDGQPIATVNNWAQGLMIVPFERGDGRFRFEQVEIWQGHALWRGREYAAPEGITEAA